MPRFCVVPCCPPVSSLNKLQKPGQLSQHRHRLPFTVYRLPFTVYRLPFTVQVFEYAPRMTNLLLLSYYSRVNIVKAQLK
jgi:hypothetical protein